MFAKLLKHEWKATAGTLGVFSLAAVGVGVFATVLLRFVASFYQQIPDLLWLPIGTMLGGAVIAIFAYVLGSEIFLVIRFYKNKFTDEGYLTFTLPVTSHQIIWSSLINFIGWTVIATVVAGLVIGTALIVGPVKEGFINQELLDSLDYWGYIFERGQWAAEKGFVTYCVMSVLNGIASALLSVFQIMTAITLGASIAKKHKVLASFGIYYGMNVVISAVSSIFSFVIAFAEAETENAYSVLSVTMGIQCVLYLALCAVAYWIMNGMMQKKLNLP